MRARWLKPEFFTDKKVAEFGPITALVFQALWCMADDGGTAPCDPDTVKAQMFYRWSAVGVPEITGALRHLSGVGRIVRYTVGDDTFAKIARWSKHQQVHKPSKFRHPSLAQGVALPVPDKCGTSAGDSAAPLPASPPPRHLDSQTPIAPNGAAVLAPPAPKRLRKNGESAPWMGAMSEAWTFGTLPPGSATLLRSVVREVGAEEAVDRLTSYCETVNAEFGSLRDFVAKHALYARAGRLAVDGVTGLPNAIGMAALGGRR